MMKHSFIGFEDKHFLPNAFQWLEILRFLKKKDSPKRGKWNFQSEKGFQPRGKWNFRRKFHFQSDLKSNFDWKRASNHVGNGISDGNSISNPI